MSPSRPSIKNMQTFLWLIILLESIFFFQYEYIAYASSNVKALYKKQIVSKAYKIKKTKQELNILKNKQKDIYKNIVIIENKIQNIEKNIFTREQNLLSLQREESELKDKINKLQKKIELATDKTNEILKIIWEIYLKTHLYPLSGLQKENLTLKEKWITEIYHQYNKEIENINSMKSHLALLYQEQKSLQKQIKSSLAKIKESKKALLLKKKQQLSQLQRIRALSLVKERQIEELISEINRIKHHLKAMSSRNIRKARGYLPWPVKYPGKILKTKKGVEIGTTQGEDIRAVFWGKVVYNGKLRGFGDVVVLYHGKGYYTLYAYLSQARVKVGKMVKQGETIGYAGFCPKLRGWGIYFEIRKGKINVNPFKWLLPHPTFKKKRNKK